MSIEPTVLNILITIVGSVLTILLGINAFFLVRLVNKIDEAHKAAHAAEEKSKGIDRIIRELVELKTDMQLFKFVITNNLGFKLPEKKE